MTSLSRVYLGRPAARNSFPKPPALPVESVHGSDAAAQHEAGRGITFGRLRCRAGKCDGRQIVNFLGASHSGTDGSVRIEAGPAGRGDPKNAGGLGAHPAKTTAR